MAWTNKNKSESSPTWKKKLKLGRNWTWADLADYTWEDLKDYTWEMFSAISWAKQSKNTSSFTNKSKS